MSHVPTILTVLVGGYALVTILFLISENRRPQSTLAWMLAFLVAPVVGLAAYFLFGRDRKLFSRQNKLLHQDLEKSAKPLLAPILAREDAEIARLQGDGSGGHRLTMLVKRNSSSTVARTREAQVLQDAPQFYDRLIEDLETARHSIHHQYFIWGADEFTDEIKAIMIRKASEGVAVRLLYDPVGSLMHLRWGYFSPMRASGVAVAPTSPLYRIHTLNYRNHRKITVIDGNVGYTGGMNIGKEHLGRKAGFRSWRDTQLRMVGDGAAILQSVFMVDWYNAVGENLFAPQYFPEMPSSDDGGIPVQMIASGPDSQWAAIRQLYSYMIGSAKRRILIQSPFFVPDATIAEALRLAALAGVEVRLMVSSHASGNPLPDWAGLTYFADVVAAGVRVFLYEAGYLHAKTIAVDSEICSIGSANIDIRSFSINYELNALLYSREMTQSLEEAFERDLAHCREFDQEEYLERNRIVRFRDSVARLFSPLL